MIEIIRTGKRAICVRFDFEGATKLLNAFETVNSRPTGVLIESAFDRGVVTPNKQGDIEALILRIKVGDGYISVDQNGIVWSFEPDEVEYALERFRECLEALEFSPAEFVQVRAGKSNDLNDVYGEMIS